MSFGIFESIGSAAIFGSLTGASAIVVGVVATAVVGGVIGGIASSISGGNFSTGMLYGAIGAVAATAVIGGVTGIGGISTSTGSLGMTGTNLTTEGVTVLGPTAAKTIATPASSSLFGGALGTSGLFAGAGGPIIQAIGAGMADDTTEKSDWDKYVEQEQLRLNEKAIDKGAEFAPDYSVQTTKMQTDSAEKQLTEKITADMEMQEIDNEAALKQTAQEYRLANENASEEWNRGLAKLESAGDVASSQTYTSGRANSASVVAAQRAAEEAEEEKTRSALAGVGQS